MEAFRKASEQTIRGRIMGVVGIAIGVKPHLLKQQNGETHLYASRRFCSR